MPEIVVGVLIAAVVAVVIVVNLIKAVVELLAEGIEYLYRLVTGEVRREKEEAQRRYQQHRDAQEQLRQAEEQFREASVNDGFPSEEVMNILTTTCPEKKIPEPLWDRFGNSATYREAVKLIRIEQERKSTTAEYKELVERFANVVACCSAPWDEVMRAMKVLHGVSSSEPFKELVLRDALQVLAAMVVANGKAPNGVGRLHHAIFARLKPDARLTVQECTDDLEHRVEFKPAVLPKVIESLAAFDSGRNTHFAADAANAYGSLVMTASRCCQPSFAVETVRFRYLQLLAPYASAPNSGTAGSTSSSTGSQSGTEFNGHCPKCVKYYPVLRLQPDANGEEVEAAYRDLAQIYHPDRFNSSNERLRRTAEEEMKKVNEAHSHIMEHFERKNR